MKKSFWLAVFAYLLPTFPLGYAWHLVTFKDAYDRLNLFRAEVIIPFGLASMLVQAVIFAWAYPKLFSTRREDLGRERRALRRRLCSACVVAHDVAGCGQVSDELGDGLS